MGKAVIFSFLFLLMVSIVFAGNFDWFYNPFTAKQDRSLSLNQTGFNFTADYFIGDGSLLTIPNYNSSLISLFTNSINYLNETVIGDLNTSLYPAYASIPLLQANLSETSNQLQTVNTSVLNINTSGNIKGMGFNLTTELKSYFDTYYDLHISQNITVSNTLTDTKIDQNLTLIDSWVTNNVTASDNKLASVNASVVNITVETIIRGSMFINSTHTCYNYPTNTHCTYYNGSHTIMT
jgi:hypothetical protein